MVEYEPDTDLRESEQIPLTEEGGIEAFLRREVLPYAPDAWYVPSSVKIGYEVSFPRYFYKPQRLRSLEQIRADIMALEAETEELLEEKQAVINHAVTPGLDADVSLEHSGIPWLGNVPDHWEVRRGGWLFRKVARPIRATDDVVTCFRDGTVTLRKNRRTEGFTESLKESGYQGVRKGDLVIHQMDAFAGAVGGV